MSEILESRFFIVRAKCGHVGKYYYIPKCFAVKAEDGSSAAKKVRSYSRVKHDHADAILDVYEVNEEEFNKQIMENNNDPYFTCTSVQEQSLYCTNIEAERVRDPHFVKETFNSKKATKKFRSKRNEVICSSYDEQIDEYYNYLKTYEDFS